MVSELSYEELSIEIRSLFRRRIAGLEERKEVNDRRNESRLNRLSEVVNGGVGQKSEYVGETIRVSGVYKGGSMPREVAEGCTDFGKIWYVI